MGLREADSEGKAKDHKRQAQHGVEGGAPHRAEAFVAIQYEDAGKKANLHLQTSQQQTRGHADRPDAQTVAKATRYPNEPLISTTKRQGEGGPEGRAAAGEHQTNQDNQQDQTQKQTNQQRGARASPPDHEATKHTRDATTTKQNKTTETNHRSKGKGNCHDNRPRESQQGKTYQGTVNMSFEWKRGQTTSLNVRLTIETEEPNTAKSRIARGKSSPLRSETRQGGGKRRGGEKWKKKLIQ